MFVILLISFLLIAALGLLLKKRFLSFTFLFLTLIWIFAVGCGFVPSLLVDQLQTHSPLQKPLWKDRNAIVVLGLGTVRWPDTNSFRSHAFGYSRLFEGARLYFDCKNNNKNCALVLTGGDPIKMGQAESQVAAAELKNLGVLQSDLLIESKSNNTFQNAQFTSEILNTKDFEQVLLVTSGTHMIRAQLYFSHFGISSFAAPADHIIPEYSLTPKALNFAVADLAWREIMSLARYWIYQKLGWNATSTKSRGL